MEGTMRGAAAAGTAALPLVGELPQDLPLYCVCMRGSLFICLFVFHVNEITDVTTSLSSPWIVPGEPPPFFF